VADPPDVTSLLDEWTRGDRRALDRLLPLVYAAELRRVAAREMRRERDGHTLQATALVHETYMRLVDQQKVDWRSRAHFFGVAAQVMRRILVDHARRRLATKRGDGVRPVSIDQALETSARDTSDRLG
jgi:RNA polymerase sigma factor (TIGR02999 family)